MDKQKFKDLTGEDPEDMFGPAWENEMLGLSEWDEEDDDVAEKEEQEWLDDEEDEEEI